MSTALFPIVHSFLRTCGAEKATSPGNKVRTRTHLMDHAKWKRVGGWEQAENW
jgi:hypothetical protein